MGLSLPKLGKKIFDQINTLDNNRTFKNQTPTNTRSVVGQLSHNGLTNTVGNLVAKPFIINPAQNAIETGRAITAEATGNVPALQASQHREWGNLQASIPGFIVNQGINAGKVLQNTPRAVMADIHGFQGKAPNAGEQQALNRGLGAFNKTTVGQALGPAQNLINTAIPESRAASEAAGYNTKATGAQKYFADPLMGTLGTVGLAKGGATVAKGAKVALKPEKTPAKSTVSFKPNTAPVPDSTPAYLRQRPGGKQVTAAEAKYRADQRSLRETGTPAFVRQNQSLADQLIRQALPTTAPPEVAGLLPAGSTTVKGPGFTMTPQANPAIIEAGQKITKIDRQLEAVRQGKASKAPSEVRALVQQRKDLAATVDAPATGVGRVRPDGSVVTRVQTLHEMPQPKAAKTPVPQEKLLNIKIANVKDPQRKAELIQERNNAQANTNLAGLEPVSPYTGAPKSPNAFNRAWQTVNGVISQHGTGGAEIARRNIEQRSQSEVGQQAFLDKIPSVGSLNKHDFMTFVQTLERIARGEPVTAAPHIQRAIAEWNQAIPEIRQRAVQAGLDVGDLGPNYFPRQYKDLFNDRNMGKMAEDMVRGGKATDLGDAMGKLQFMKNEYQRPFGNLEKTREFDMPDYEMTHEALINYINRSYDRITKAEQFGAKNEILNELQGRMQQEGYDATPGSVADKYIKIALGDVYKGTVAHKVSGGVRSFNALRSLSAAGVSNASQLTNTATIAGVARTAKAVVKSAVSPKARAEARQSGVLLEHSISNLAAQGLGTTGAITRNIASPFFRQVEKFNRQATAIVGKDYGNHLAKKGDVSTLRNKFGVTGEIGKTLTREQEIQVSRKLVELAQFKVDPMDLPGWVDSPMGKIVAQFRTFGYKQSDFMYNQVLREAVKGNFLPLTRFVAVGVPAGAASLAVKGAIKGTQYTQPDESNASKVSKYAAAVGGLGLPGSEGQNLYKSNQYGNTIGGVAGTFGGPTASLIAETSVNADKAKRGNSTALQKEGVRSIPAVGPSIANRVFPKTAQTKPVTADNKDKATVADLAAQDKKETDAFKKANKGGGYGLTQLTSGKYIYQIGNDVKTSTDLDKARKAIAKDSFTNSDAKKKLVGDTYYYKNAAGDVKTKSKVLYDWEQTDAKDKLEMDRAYEAKDLNKWVGLAQKQYDNLESKKSLYDPETEQDEIDKITLQQENLQQKAEKYMAKGINGSGGSGGSGGGSSNNVGSAYKYAVSLNAGGSIARPKVSIRQSGGVRGAGRPRTGSKPKVSIKRSLV